MRVVVFGVRGLGGVEGGVETHARELYPRLAELGLDVLVLVRRRYGRAAAAAGSGAREVQTRALWAPAGRGIEAFVHSAVSTAYCLVTRSDVVHVHGIGPGVFAAAPRLARRRVVLTHHGHDYDATKWGPVARRLLRWCERISVRSAHSVIAVSQGIADDLHRDYGVAAHVIRNGIPSWPPAGGGHHRVLAAVGDRRFVLVVGRLTSHKRVLDVVQAMDDPSLRDVALVVCGAQDGNDPATAAIVDAAQANPRVVLAGHVDHHDLRPLFEHASCTVMASSYEGMPFAVLEAIGAGCPVVLSAIPAHTELDLAPFQYFPVGDVVGLVRCLVAVLAMRRPQATDRQSQLVGDPRFDWRCIAEATAGVLRGTTAGRLAAATSVAVTGGGP